MKKRFIAFYDVLCFSIIVGIMWTTAIIMLITGQFGNFNWLAQNWYLVVIYAICIAVPATAIPCLQKITIDLSKDKVEAFYLVDFVRNERDLRTNWIVYPSEVEKVEVVHLSKEEKRRYTSARFLFSKYLKITHKYGHVKYLYVAHYSNAQIQSIVKLLTSDKTKSKSLEK